MDTHRFDHLPPILCNRSGLFAEPPRNSILDEVALRLADHLARTGAARPPDLLRRAVVERALVGAVAGEVGREGLEAYCIASTQSRYRRTMDLPRDDAFTKALQIVQAAFEAEEILCLVPQSGGAFLTAPALCIRPTHLRALTPVESLAYQVLAQATAIVGTPVDITNREEDQPSNMFVWARRALPGEMSVTCVPLYAWEETATPRAAPRLTAVLCLRRSPVEPPFRLVEWYRNLWFCTMPDLLRLPATAAAITLPTATASPASQWQQDVDMLDRATLPWMPPPPRRDRSTPPEWTMDRLSDLNHWLAGLIQRLGLLPPDPQQLHPYALKQRLARALSAEAAEELSTTAEHSALSLSQTARDTGWRSSVHAMVAAVGQQFKRRHTLLTLFAGYQQRGKFFIADALVPPPIDERELATYILLAQIGALVGEPAFIAATDRSNPLYTVARSVLEVERDMLSIPVYAWREPEEPPAFHGLFLVIRHRDAPPPTPLEWLQWLLFCQTMHTPLNTIANELVEVYKPHPAAIRRALLPQQE